MKNNKVKLIYLLGAGRSGTTVMASLLNAHSDIQTAGEMHQFLEHLAENKKCSCGEYLNFCQTWSKVLSDLQLDLDSIDSEMDIVLRAEQHRNILQLMFAKKSNEKYLNSQEKIFESVSNTCKNKYVLDSSKYIARYLLLKQSSKISIKGLYIVRDVRGVINSFNKKVQTPRRPISTILYYLLINFFAQIICWYDSDVIKVRYEDFVKKPNIELQRIYNHIFKEGKIKAELPEVFDVPHIIGGNRLKSNKQIKISADNHWKTAITRTKQICYYILAFPIMFINKYKI